MADLENFLARHLAIQQGHFRQDRIAHVLERLRDQRRADDPGRMAGAERHHAAAPALRDRQRQQIAHQVDDVLQVVVEADALRGIGADARPVFVGQAGRPADAGMKAGIFRQGCCDHAFADIGFDQHQRLAVRGGAIADRPDIKRGMRPGRLRQVLDDAGNVVVAFDEDHVAGLERCEQRRGIGRREGLVALRRLFQIAGENAPDSVRHETHVPPLSRRPDAQADACFPVRGFFFRALLPAIYARTIAN